MKAPKVITLRQEREPLSSVGYVWRAFYASGVPLYMADADLVNLVDKVRAYENVERFVKEPLAHV